MKFQISPKTKKGDHVLYAIFGNTRQVVRKSVSTKNVLAFLVDLLKKEVSSDQKIVKESQKEKADGEDNIHSHSPNGSIVKSFKTEFTDDMRVEVVPGSVSIAQDYLLEDDCAPQRVAQILHEVAESINLYYTKLSKVLRSMEKPEINEFEIQYDVVDGIPQWDEAFLVDKKRQEYTKDNVSRDSLVKLLSQMDDRLRLTAKTKRIIQEAMSISNDGLEVNKLICVGGAQGFKFTVPDQNPEVTQIIEEITEFFPINPFAGMDPEDIK